MLERINSGNFSAAVLQSELPVLLDFYSTWCVPCRLLLAELERISETSAEKVRVGRVNVEYEPELTAKYRIYEIPTVIVFRNGRPTGRPFHRLSPCGGNRKHDIENMKGVKI